MPYGSSKPVFGDILKLTYIENPGMAFGLDVGPKMFLTLFTIAASLVILFYIFKHRHDSFLLRLSLAFILAGAVGNLIDRTFYGKIYGYAPLFFGKVVDFVQVGFWDFTFLGRTYTSWPIFNVADVSVSLGFLIILVFHKRIFKQSDELPVIVSHEGAVIKSSDVIHDIGGIHTHDAVPNEHFKPETNNTLTKIENPKENDIPGPGGTKENKD